MEWLIGLLIHFGPMVWALYDLSQGTLSTGSKILWALAVIFMPCLGPLLYFFFGRSQRARL